MASSKNRHKTKKARDSILFWSVCVLMPGFVHQELAGAKAQISYEDSLCPGLKRQLWGSCQDPLPSPPCFSGMGLPLSEHLSFSGLPQSSELMKGGDKRKYEPEMSSSPFSSREASRQV